MFKSDITTQCSAWADPWAQLRDYAKPVVPRDVADLEAVRDFLPPSKAHIKRIQRFRPVVTVQRVTAPPPADERRGFASAHSVGMPIRRRLHPGRFFDARPLDVVVAPVLVPRPYTARDRFDQQIAESVRLVRMARKLMPTDPTRKLILRDATACLRRAAAAA